MIDYDKQFNDIIAQIQAQYRGSNVAELIKGIIEIKKKGVLRAYKSLIDDCLNLSTAKGDALDLWGYILGINRFVPRDSNQDAKENFKQWVSHYHYPTARKYINCELLRTYNNKNKR